MTTKEPQQLGQRTEQLGVAGIRFGKLTALNRVNSNGKQRWRCQCDCGSLSVVAMSNLVTGHSKSCGCLRAEFNKSSRTTHGMRRTRIYSIWTNMIDRCENPKNRGFHRYGGRGIKVCKRWRTAFINFFNDVGHPKPGLQLDRKNNSLGYSPRNVRWTTSKQNNRNRDANHRITLDGKTRCLAEWQEVTGLSQRLLYNRLRDGWSVRRALSTPLNIKYQNTLTAP